jgi:hypothetical protein
VRLPAGLTHRRTTDPYCRRRTAHPPMKKLNLRAGKWLGGVPGTGGTDTCHSNAGGLMCYKSRGAGAYRRWRDGGLSNVMVFSLEPATFPLAGWRPSWEERRAWLARSAGISHLPPPPGGQDLLVSNKAFHRTRGQELRVGCGSDSHRVRAGGARLKVKGLGSKPRGLS